METPRFFPSAARPRFIARLGAVARCRAGSSVARSVLHSRLLLRAPPPDRAVGVAPSASRRRLRAVGVIVSVHRRHRRSRPCSSPRLRRRRRRRGEAVAVSGVPHAPPLWRLRRAPPPGHSLAPRGAVRARARRPYRAVGAPLAPLLSRHRRPRRRRRRRRSRRRGSGRRPRRRRDISRRAVVCSSSSSRNPAFGIMLLT